MAMGYMCQALWETEASGNNGRSQKSYKHLLSLTPQYAVVKKYKMPKKAHHNGNFEARKLVLAVITTIVFFSVHKANTTCGKIS
jgi:hypothetical protein